MRTLTASGDLRPAGKASTATRIIFYHPPLWFYPTEEINSRTLIQYAMDYSTFWKMKVLETKSSQALVFDPGSFTGRLRACPFLRTWPGLLCGEGLIWAPDGTRGWSIFWQKDDWKCHFMREVQAIRYTERIAVDRCFSAARLFWICRQSLMARGYASCGDKRMSGNVMERGA